MNPILDISPRGLCRWSQIYLIPIILVDVISTRTPYGVYLGKQHEYIREVHLSTRTHYGVYPGEIHVAKQCKPFNARPLRSVSGTESKIIKAYELSTRTHYGVYHVWCKILETDCSFNSHSLRSVSVYDSYLLNAQIISTRTLYGVYHNMIADSGLRLLFQLAPSTECILLFL